MTRRFAAALVLGAALLAPGPSRADEPSLPSPGDRGTVVTVLTGTRTQEIPLTFLGTYRDFAGPGYDLHLVQLEGPVADEIGVAAGMSGSPVYFEGRLLGALAYRMGALPKQAVAGVTPVEMMRDAAKLQPAGNPQASASIAPIATPVMVGGMQPAVREWLEPRLAEMGFVTVAGGSAGAGATAGLELQPGSPVGVELVRGDARIAATGTVTWVDGHTVYAFGHPFLGTGRVEMPMVEAEVIHTLADMAGSVKLANVGSEIGAIVEDRWTAVVGDTTRRAGMIPMRLSVEGADYGRQSYGFEVVRSSDLAPLLAATVAANALQTNTGYTRESTLHASGTVRLGDLPDLPLDMAFSGAGGSDPTFGVAVELFTVLGALWNNPFEELEVESIELDVRARAEIVQYTLEGVHYDRKPLRPGQSLDIRCVLRKYRDDSFVTELSLPIPEQMPQTRDLMLAVGSASYIEAALGNPGARRLMSVADLPSLVRVLAERRSDDLLTAVVYEPGRAVVSRGETYMDLPPTAERLLATQAGGPLRTAAGRMLQGVVSPLVRVERELEGPVSGGVRVRLRFDGRLEAEENK